MTVQFPTDPYDGQQVVVENEQGVVIYTYDKETNSWSYKEYGHVGREHVTFTDQVLVRENTAHSVEARLKGLATKAELDALRAQVDKLSEG